MNWIFNKKPEDIEGKSPTREVLIALKYSYGWSFKIDRRVDMLLNGETYRWCDYNGELYNIPCWCELEEPKENVSE